MNRLAWTLVALLLTTPVLAQDRDQLERRLQSVATLIESSSAARQIEASGDAGAREKRDNARLIHREATLTLQRGDVAAAAKLLDQAAREMMNGVRLAKPEQLAGEQAKREFATRLESAKALLVAQQRITQEKGNASEATTATRNIEGLIADAEKRAAAGQIGEARPLVDRAYLTARVSIESMRRGDTLVRSLNFATPREEYDYELDRNETHRMLIQVLLADRKDKLPGMQVFIDRAATMRVEAEGQAKRGEHAAAIKTLEDSTRELVRAIRAGGIYIPG
ncbi:conserved exported hypothetical protein [Rubrivivax sp. A210]|uniref:hypothetical protein n=1 Tax=Rubrivivax sp. A210 TaxID=2772301 RepID=UPI001918CF9F|nr:hypothetical protein [Rubrivivax sp. A210]CAD5372308.1 conserved exported hypothetical protein [Rubrivivax sp. A210]